MSAALELTDNARARIRELEALSPKAEAGEAGARQELRQALRESAPEVIVRCSDTARVYRRLLAKTASGNDMLKEDAIVEQARMLASEVAGENPTTLEVLLAERIASLWVFVEFLEALHAAYFVRSDHKKPPISYLLKMVKVQESTNRRYLAAIKTLAQVRKLQVNTPGIQFNTQSNVER